MARQIDYPRASLKNSLQLAQAIDDLGGKCKVEMAADKMNKKVSGAFQALVGSAARFGLVENKKGFLNSTGLYRDYKLAYTKEESDIALSVAFLTPPLFRSIYDRFKGRKLPLEHFEKLLIREFHVPEQISSRVSKYFLEGAKQCALLNANNEMTANTAEDDFITEENEPAVINDIQELNVDDENDKQENQKADEQQKQTVVHKKLITHQGAEIAKFPVGKNCTISLIAEGAYEKKSIEALVAQLKLNLDLGVFDDEAETDEL